MVGGWWKIKLEGSRGGLGGGDLGESMYKNKGIAAIFKHNFIFLKHLKIFNNRILYKLQKGEQEYFVKELGWGGGKLMIIKYRRN